MEVVRRDNVIDGEVAAVVELDPFADIDFPNCLIVFDGFPFGRHFGLHVDILIDPGQRVVDVLDPDMNALVRMLGGLQALVFRITR